MKLIRFEYGGSVHAGVLNGEEISEVTPPLPRKGVKACDITFLAPVVPSKVVAVGLNYRDHAKELDMDIPEEPVLFIKPSTAVIGPGCDIIYPSRSSRVDYEAELAVVIKEKARNVTKEAANRFIAGYVCMNDVTARDLQKIDNQWSRAKSFDTFAPIGPWVETELDTSDLRVRSYLNGEMKQDSSTADLIFSVQEIVSFVSGVMTLLPGDVVATGTPPNVGPMSPGDEVVIEIDGIGRLNNRVQREGAL